MHMAEALVAFGGDVAVFTRARDRLDPAWINATLKCGDEVVSRRRKMPVEVVIWLIIGANLLAEGSYTDIMRHMGLTAHSPGGFEQTAPTSGSIAEARKRVGWQPLAETLRASAKVWNAEITTNDLRFHGYQVLACDGVVFSLPDTPTNEKTFGRPTNQAEREAAFPQARAVALVDTGTQVAMDAEIGPYATGEKTLLAAMVDRIPDHSVTLFDRNFYSTTVLHSLRKSGENRHWLLRARKDCAYQLLETHGDGDDLVAISPSWQTRKNDPSMPEKLIVRLLRFSNGTEEILLLTSLVDVVAFPAKEVAELYLRRWYIEMAFDNLKTEQRCATRTLRSKTPDGVRQELLGLFLAYNVVRVEMGRAAKLVGAPPSRLSFHRARLEICHFMLMFRHTTAPGRALHREVALRETLAYLLLPEREQRSYPRALKQTSPRYPQKRRAKAAVKGGDPS